MVHRSEKRKSKFQERLEAVQKAHEEMTRNGELSNVKRHTEETQPSEEDARSSQTAQLPRDPMVWKVLKHEKPRYYDPINLWDGNSYRYDWYRVSNGEKDYYCNNNDDRVLSPDDITHWSPPAGVKYPPYQPMTEDDIKEFSRRDLKHLIERMKDEIIPNNQIPNDNPDQHHAFNTGLKTGITVITTFLKPRRMTDDKKDNQ